MTYDYFKTVHNRNGIKNDGKGAVSRVHYSTNYANAYCECALAVNTQLELVLPACTSGWCKGMHA